MEITFKITEVNQEFLLKYPPCAVDGTITITVKNALFFNEEGVSLMDLAISINGWLHKLKLTPLVDFDYSSDEYEENPVIHLTNLDRFHYTLRSAWVPNDSELILEADEITRCFRGFLHELNAVIQRDYGVALSNMRFFNSPWPTIYPA
jgi:hypothetical protein